MRLLIDGWPTGQNKLEFVVLAEVVDHFRPSHSVPQFFPARRTGMQNHVRSGDFPISPKRVSFFADRSRKIELRSGRSSTDAERLKQSEIVVDRVHVPHTYSNKICVKSGACLRLVTDTVRGDAFPGAREKGQNSRTIVPRKVDAIIESLAGKGRKHCEVP